MVLPRPKLTDKRELVYQNRESQSIDWVEINKLVAHPRWSHGFHSEDALIVYTKADEVQHIERSAVIPAYASSR